MESITKQQVTDLLMASKVDSNGHLFITRELYNDYFTWFLHTLKQRHKGDFLELKWNRPTKFQSTMCNIIAGSYQSVTGNHSPISTVCIGLLDGSYEYVNV